MQEKVAIVSGTSRGLGKALREALRETHIVPDAPRSRLDITSEPSIRAFVADVMAEHGRIDLLINSAAILGPVGVLETNPWQEWQETINVNLLGAVRLTVEVLPIMKAQGHGKIINIAGGGATNPLPRRTAYAASKAALVRFTESLAEEGRIEVNAVLPGPLPTDMLDDIIAAGPEALGAIEHAEHIRLNSDGALERALALCLYLASPESDGITGKTFSARYDQFPFTKSLKRAMAKSQIFSLRRVV